MNAKQKELCDALKKGNCSYESIARLVDELSNGGKSPEELDFADDDGNTVLHIAIQYGSDPRIVDKIIEVNPGLRERQNKLGLMPVSKQPEIPQISIGKIMVELKNKYRDCINPETGKSVFDDIDPAQFENEIREILKGAKQPDIASLDDADLFAVGDLHADYKTFLKLLFASNLIDANGMIKPEASGKKLVTLGDIITSDIRTFPDAPQNGLKSYLLVLALQELGKRKGLEVVNVFGNHEQDFLFAGKGTKMSESLLKVNGGFNLGQQIAIKQALKKDVQEGRFQLSYAENGRNIFCTHAGLEKATLVECLKQMLASRGIEIPPELKEVKEYEIVGKKIALQVEPDGRKKVVKGDDIRIKMFGPKIKSEALYKIMSDHNITPEDISKFMNDKFKFDVGRDYFTEGNVDIQKDKLYASGAVINVDGTFMPVATTYDGKTTSPAFIIENTPAPFVPFAPTATGVMWTTKKLFRRFLGSRSNPKDIKPGKMIQIVGHHPMAFLERFFTFCKGAIKRMGNTFLGDFGGGFKIFIHPDNGRRDMDGLEKAGLIAMNKKSIFSIEYNYESKEWQRCDETAVTIPSRRQECARTSLFI